MSNLKFGVIFGLVMVCLGTPACGKKKKNYTVVPENYVDNKPISDQKIVSVFDGDLDAFVIDEDESAFGAQAGFELVDESEADLLADQSRYGFMPIYFEFDEKTMKPAQTGALENDMARAKKMIAEGKRISIEGHACKYAGSPEYNLQLSEKRAQSVYDYFVKNGIPAKKLSIVGRGNEMCVVPHGNKEQQAPNRRVEFVALAVK